LRVNVFSVLPGCWSVSSANTSRYGGAQQYPLQLRALLRQPGALTQFQPLLLLRLLPPLLLFLFLFGFARPAYALDPAARLADYNHTIWTAKHGAPAEIGSLAQTPDGCLWLGAPSGLYRFDGASFQHYESPDGVQLQNSRISVLSAQRNGDLWVGYALGGLAVIRDGTLRSVATDKELEGGIYTVAIDTDGSVWAAAGSGLFHREQGGWRRIGKEHGLPGAPIMNVMVNKYGQLWANNGERFYLLNRRSGNFEASAIPGGPASMVESPDGRLWRADFTRRIEMPPPARAVRQPRQAWFNQTEGRSAGLFDKDGNFWTLNCPTGICLMHNAARRTEAVVAYAGESGERLDQPGQMGGLAANIILEDLEGNIWVGTQAGLEKFRNNKLTPLRIPAGERYFSLATDAEGGLWAASMSTETLWHVAPGAPPVAERSQHYRIVANGSDGALLLGGRRSIERRYRGRVEVLPLPPGPDGRPVDHRIKRIVDDGEGLWVWLKSSGALRLAQGGWRTAEALGLPGNGVYLAAAGHGQVWMGYGDGSVVFFDKGRLNSYDAALMGRLGYITCLHHGPELIAAGTNGAAVMRNGAVRPLRARNPDVLKNITGILVTPNGDRWFNGGKGIVHIAASDWRDAMGKPEAALRYTLMDGLDGYPGEGSTGTFLPTAVAGSDGRLWFSASNGIVSTSLAAFQRYNTVAPAVVVQSMKSERQRFPYPRHSTTLEAGTTSLDIEYTAFSYAVPERLRFRYQLDGVSSRWQDAGGRRAAYFTNLSPGQYQFRVWASNDNGVWNPQGTSLAFTIPPTPVQTVWFKLLCVLALLAALWLAYRLQQRRSAMQAQRRLEERLSERERIARELHDTLLQSVQGMILQFEAVALRTPKAEPNRALMESALQTAEAVLNEGRDRVQGLRQVGIAGYGLVEALREVAAVLASGARPALFVATRGEVRKLHPIVEEELHAIGREAMLNAVRHADAGNIRVEIVFGRKELQLVVHDDGRGIEPAVLAEGGRHGHWGLKGMEERAHRIRARFRLASSPGEGTRVAVTLPASLAFCGRLPCLPWQW
jgi:signal transduction histidine kinase